MPGFFSIFGGRNGSGKNGKRPKGRAGYPAGMRTPSGTSPAAPPWQEQERQDAQREWEKIEREVEAEEAIELGLDAFADPEDRFVYGGEWQSNFSSSNVAAYHYDLEGRFDNAPETLVIEYKDGSFYGYSPVSESLARSLYRAGSKGTWVWDHLRVRGTVFGFQVPYFFMASRSRAVRLWMQTAGSRLRHGAIPATGEHAKGYHPLLNPLGQREPTEKTPVAAKIGFGGRERGGANEAPKNWP